MIFSIQRFLEDYFHRCGFKDSSQYAVSVAALYDRERHRKDVPSFLAAMKRLRTTFFRRNESIQRPVFEKRILAILDTEFKKKDFVSSHKPSRQELKLRANV
jgi:hypothetical protein